MKNLNASITIVLLLGLASAAWSSELEERLEDARKRLDAAAAELAEAYAEAYSGEDRHHREDRAMLGVLLDDCCARDGVRLSGVTPGGGADQIGLEAGDVLVEIGSIALDGAGHEPMRKLTRFMRDVAPGDEVDVAFLRDRQRRTATITTQAHSQQTMRMLREKVTRIGADLGAVRTRIFAPDPPAPPGASALAFMDVDGDLASYFGVDEGVLVLREPGEDSGLKAGDVLLSIDGEAPEDAAQAYERLREGEEDITVAVMRQGERQALTLAPDTLFSGIDRSVRIIKIQTD